MLHKQEGGGDRSPPPRGSGLYLRSKLYLELLRVLVAPLVEEAVALLLVPEDVVLVPILGLLRQALALPEPTERLYLVELFPGRRRLAELARTVCEGLVILFTPRLAPFLVLVDRQRNFWLPRLVKLEPSIPVEPVADGREGLVAGLAALLVADRRVTVFNRAAGLSAAVPASLTAALFQRPSISSLLFIAHPSKSSEAEAGRAAAKSRNSNNGTIDALMKRMVFPLYLYLSEK